MNKIFKRVKAKWRKLVNTPIIEIDGVKINTAKGSLPKLVRSSLYKETYEDAERKLVAGVLKPGMQVVEIGCGVGFISLLAAKICGEGQVASFEANPQLESIIRNNYALNGLRPDLNMRAVTVDGQPITFYRNDNVVSSSLYDRNSTDEKLTLESVAFDHILKQYKPAAIVMDIEGAEIDLLSTVDLAGVRHLIVELHPHIVGEQKISALTDHLVNCGFTLLNKIHKTVQFSRID